MTQAVFDPANLATLESDLSGKNPRVILNQALALFDSIALSFSGAEDVVLIDLAVNINPNIKVFTLDTGRLHAETYQFIELVRKHYQLNLTVLYPDAQPLQALVRNKGLFSFYEEGHQQCCNIRKVEPLRRHLNSVDAWITGQRKDQSDETRLSLPEVQKDPAFSTEDHCLIKFNPLANWSSAQVWDHIEAYQVPFNPLHNQGYRSIGCEPCTRPTRPHQQEREGRWWWEDATQKECGLHVSKA